MKFWPIHNASRKIATKTQIRLLDRGKVWKDCAHAQPDLGPLLAFDIWTVFSDCALHICLFSEGLLNKQDVRKLLTESKLDRHHRSSIC